jgi:hypothetical protein
MSWAETWTVPNGIKISKKRAQGVAPFLSMTW